MKFINNYRELLIISIVSFCMSSDCAKPSQNPQKQDVSKADGDKTVAEKQKSPADSGAAAAASAPKADVKASAELNPMDASLQLIKEYVSGSGFRILDWQEAQKDAEYVDGVTLCHNSSAAIIYALALGSEDSENYFDFSEKEKF